MSLFYLRGCHFKPQGIPPYQLGPAERGKSPDELIGQAIKCALAEVELPAGRGTEMEYLKKRLSALRDEVTVLDRSYLRAKQWVILQRNGTLKGDTLYNIGFWNLLQYYLSSEAFLLAHDGLGYESVLANWNAAEAIPWFLSDFVTEYRTLKEGMLAIPKELARSCKERHPNSFDLHHGYRLRSVKRATRNGNPLLELSFEVT